MSLKFNLTSGQLFSAARSTHVSVQILTINGRNRQCNAKTRAFIRGGESDNGPIKPIECNPIFSCGQFCFSFGRGLSSSTLHWYRRQFLSLNATNGPSLAITPFVWPKSPAVAKPVISTPWKIHPRYCPAVRNHQPNRRARPSRPDRNVTFTLTASGQFAPTFLNIPMAKKMPPISPGPTNANFNFTPPQCHGNWRSRELTFCPGVQCRFGNATSFPRARAGRAGSPEQTQ